MPSKKSLRHARRLTPDASPPILDVAGLPKKTQTGWSKKQRFIPTSATDNTGASSHTPQPPSLDSKIDFPPLTVAASNSAPKAKPGNGRIASNEAPEVNFTGIQNWLGQNSPPLKSRLVEIHPCWQTQHEDVVWNFDRILEAVALEAGEIHLAA